MRTEKLVAGLLACLFGSSEINAEVVSFDCDTPGSHSSEFARDVSKTSLEAGGAVRLVEERPFRNAIPAANIFFSKEPGVALVGLRFIAYPEKRKVISVMLFRDGQPDAQKVIAEIQKTSDAIPFNMSMRDQEVTVVVAGQTFVMPVSKGTVKQISLSCFSAQFKFAAVELKESD